MSNFYGIIYKITNTINNKSYIGMTTRTLEHRWAEHVSAAYSSQSVNYNNLFKKAIRKYPMDCWNKIVIDSSNIDLNDLKEKEKYWIKYYNTYAFSSNGYGYNATRGGDCYGGCNDVSVVIFDPLTLRKIKTFDNKVQAAEYLHLSQIPSNWVGVKNHALKGLCLVYQKDIENKTEEEQKEYVFSLYPNHVCQLDLYGKMIQKYFSIMDVVNKNISFSFESIRKCCKDPLDNSQMAFGYQWCYAKDFFQKENKVCECTKVHGSMPIVQIDAKNHKVVNIFSSIREVAIYLYNDYFKTLCSRINKSCARHTKLGGFYWDKATPEQIRVAITNHTLKV